MSDEIKLRMDYAMPVGHEPQYERIRVFFDKPKPCPLKVNIAEDEDAMVATMLPNDSELISLLGGDPNAPHKANPYKEAADLALAEALVEDLTEQVHRLANDTDRKEREELEALGMQSDEELTAMLGRRQ